MQRQRLITTIENVIEKKNSSKAKLDIIVSIKLTITTEGENRKKKKKSKRIYRTSENTRIINVFLESLPSASFPSLGVTVHLASLICPATLHWSLDLLWRQLRL